MVLFASFTLERVDSFCIHLMSIGHLVLGFASLFLRKLTDMTDLLIQAQWTESSQLHVLMMQIPPKPTHFFNDETPTLECAQMSCGH